MASSQPAARLPWVDAVRGASILMICASHFLRFLPALEWLRRFAAEPVGVFSLAEVFVFLSGRAAAAAYFVDGRPSPDAKARLKRRLVWLYATHLASVAVVLALRLAFRPAHAAWLGAASPLKSMLLGAVLLYCPMLLGILPLYIALLAFLLIGIDHLGDRPARARLLFCSGAAWIAAQAYGPHPRVVSALVLMPFNLAAWQLMFAAGLLAGLDPDWKELLRRRRGAILRFCAAAVLALLAARYLPRVGGSRLLSSLADKGTLGPLRLANLLLAYGLCAALFAPGAEPAAPGWLTRIGRRSLPLFLASILSTYLLRLRFFGNPRLWTPSAQVLALGAFALTLGWYARWLERLRTRS